MRTTLSRAAVELARIMRDRGLTQEALASMLQPHLGRRPSQMTISRSLSGTTPRIDLMLAYRTALGIPVESWCESVELDAA